MKGYLIDSAARKVRAVALTTREINTLVAGGEAGFSVGWQWVCGDLLCVSNNLEPNGYGFRVRRQDLPYAGNGLVIPADLSGKPALRASDVLAEIAWLSDRRARQGFAEHALDLTPP